MLLICLPRHPFTTRNCPGGRGSTKFGFWVVAALGSAGEHDDRLGMGPRRTIAPSMRGVLENLHDALCGLLLVHLVSLNDDGAESLTDKSCLEHDSAAMQKQKPIYTRRG